MRTLFRQAPGDSDLRHADTLLLRELLNAGGKLVPRRQRRSD